jgi:hypothetical protein
VVNFIRSGNVRGDLASGIHGNLAIILRNCVKLRNVLKLNVDVCVSQFKNVAVDPAVHVSKFYVITYSYFWNNSQNTKKTCSESNYHVQ